MISRWPPPIAVAPFVVFVYALWGLAAARSETPMVFGRYSIQAAALLVLCIAIYGAALVALARGRHALIAAALGALVAVTFIVPGSNAVQRVPFVQFVLPVVRALAACALIHQQARRFARVGATNGPMLAAAAVLAVWALTDVGIAAVTRSTPPHARTSVAPFRYPYDVQAIPPEAIVLIGDSFVWGQGVAAEETFGARLEARYRDAGFSTPVYSLGAVGAGLSTYLTIVSQLPPGRRVDRIALFYYVNDMPPKPRLTDTFRNQMITLGVGAPTLRLVGDLVGRSLMPSLEQYHVLLVEDYDVSGATFEGRWRALEGQLTQFHEQAEARSLAMPALVILPLMVDFADYPLIDAHGRLADLGGRLGYKVVDLLPVFREQVGDGRRHLVSAQDNHFDASTHEVVARAMYSALSAP